MLTHQPGVSWELADAQDGGDFVVSIRTVDSTLATWASRYMRALRKAHGSFVGILGDVAFKVPFLPSGV